MIHNHSAEMKTGHHLLASIIFAEIECGIRILILRRHKVYLFP